MSGDTAFEGVSFEDAPPEVLAEEDAAAARSPCSPVKRSDGLQDCAAPNCDFLGGRCACYENGR